MKINIPKITRALALTDYAPQMVDEAGKPVTLHVWVNPMRGVLERHAELAEAGDLTALAAWWAQLWSQGPEDTRWTVEEVQALSALDTDPGLMLWCMAQSFQMIRAHRSVNQKK